MGLSAVEPQAGFYEQELGPGKRYRYGVIGGPVRRPVYRVPSSQYMGRRRLWSINHRNGHSCAVPLAALDRFARDYRVAGPTAPSPNPLLSDWLRDSLVCLFAPLPAYIRRHGPLPELRYQRLSMAPGRHPLPPAKSARATAGPSRCRLLGKGGGWRIAILSSREGSDVRDCGGRR